jgi:hypothetical protein
MNYENIFLSSNARLNKTDISIFLKKAVRSQGLRTYVSLARQAILHEAS